MTPRIPSLDEYIAQPTPLRRALRWLLFAHRGPVIFDIGACEGEDSICYARMFRRSRVFSFEPLPANQAIVRANFARYRVTNVELVPLALSSHAGTAQFHVSAGEPAEKFAGEDWNYGNKSSSLLPPADAAPMQGWITFPTKTTVTCETLDHFCAARGIERIDFVHMDVQGAEHLVLAGAERMLSAVTAVWLEVAEGEVYRGQWLRPEIQSLLEARGFHLVFGISRGVEGDQFYVQRRHWRGWLVALWHGAMRLAAQWRRFVVKCIRGAGLYSLVRRLLGRT